MYLSTHLRLSSGMPTPSDALLQALQKVVLLQFRDEDPGWPGIEEYSTPKARQSSGRTPAPESRKRRMCLVDYVIVCSDSEDRPDHYANAADFEDAPDRELLAGGRVLSGFV